MSLAGQLLVVGFEGTALTAEERRLLVRFRPGAVVLFARNLEDVGGVLTLVGELRRLLPDVILATDAEGGRVDRLRRLVGPAPAADALADRKPAVAGRAGLWMGHVLRSFGIDLDFAPVVDLDHGRVGNALDRRCFGRSPRSVVARAGAFLAGLQRAGVAGCLKHFPGLGPAGEDTHHLGASIPLGRRALRRELVPFERVMAGADAMMVGHASYPGWDPQALPASLSAAITTTLLKERMGFGRIVFSDDLEMDALGRWGDLAERAARSLAAGCDGLLVCRRLAEIPAVVERLDAPGLAPRRQAAHHQWATLRGRLAALRSARGAVPSLDEVRRALARLAKAVDQNGMSSSPGGK